MGAGTFHAPNGAALTVEQAFCRVEAVARPSTDSDIRFEVWLPLEWNGRMWGVGNGNFAGQISYHGLATHVAEGYATVATDAGHAADSMDSTWALGHAEKVTDFGHRAVHEATANAKRLVATFYGRPPNRSYFGSCSDGGREALMEAQRYPEDYDGIIAGAPAYDWTRLFIAAGLMQKWLLDESHRIPVAKLPALESAALKACDQLDGRQGRRH